LDTLGKFFSQVLLAVGALVLSRSALALAHAHGWYPEKQLVQVLMRLKARVRKIAWRLVANCQGPPCVKDAPGLVWRRRKEGWMAIWQARPDFVRKGYRPRDFRIALAEEFTPTMKEFISDQCVRLQSQMLEHRLKYEHVPSMQELLASIRRIIAEDTPQYPGSR
jgi:hypothetical protein